MTSLAWLHISDLHQSVRARGWLEPRVKEAVVQDLKRLHEQMSSSKREKATIDLVIVSGDLSRHGAPEELEEADRSLEKLREVLQDCGSDPWILAVPGNHDLARPRQPSPEAMSAMRRWHDDPRVREEFWSDPTSPARRLVDRAFEPFDRWWREHCARESARGGGPAGRLTLKHGLLPGDFTATIEKRGLHFGVAGLNSAFLQNTGDDYEKRLAVEPYQLRIAAGGDVPGWVSEHDAVILVTHHAPDWLPVDLVKRYKTAINPAGRFSAHLCGHLHAPMRDDEHVLPRGDGGPRCVEGEKSVDRPLVRCPSFFGDDVWEDRRGRLVQRAFGYNAALLDLEGGMFYAYPRRWKGGSLMPEEPVKEDVRITKFPRTKRPFRPESAALRDALASLHPSADKARELAATADVQIPPGSGAAVDVWHVVVSEAERRVSEAERYGRLATLVNAAHTNDSRDDLLNQVWATRRQAEEPAPAREIRRGSREEMLAELLYDSLSALPPVVFEAVLGTLALTARIPGEDAPQSARASAVVRQAAREGLPGLERLLAVVLHALGRSPDLEPGRGGDGRDLDSWVPFVLGVLGRTSVGAAARMLATTGQTSNASARRVPSRAALSRLLAVMFSDERDFDGFVLDRFPEVYRRFTNGMNRAYRIGLLLEQADPAKVVSALQRAHPSAFRAHEDVLAREDVGASR